MSAYSDTHPLEFLRGRTMPEPADVRRELAIRIQWLRHRIELQLIDGRPPGRELPELKAMLALRAVYDQAYPPEPASDTDRPPAGEAGT